MRLSIWSGRQIIQWMDKSRRLMKGCQRAFPNLLLLQVPPGAVLPHDLPATPGLSLYTGTSNGLPVSGKVPGTSHSLPPTAGGGAGALATAGTLWAHDSMAVEQWG